MSKQKAAAEKHESKMESSKPHGSALRSILEGAGQAAACCQPAGLAEGTSFTFSTLVPHISPLES